MPSLHILTRVLPATLACALLVAQPAAAQNEFNLAGLEPGQLLLQLNASEQVEVEQDRLSATLQYSAQGRDKAALQDEVNRSIAEALALLEAESTEGVEHATGQYYVYQFEAGRPARGDVQEPLWRAQQSLELTGTNSGALLDLAGRLQEAGLHMTGLYYSLSPQRQAEVSDGLLSAALAKLQARADQAAAALGKRSAALIEVSIHDSGPGLFYKSSMMAMDARAATMDIAAPVASPGKSEVQLNVSARALLSP